MSHLFDTAKGHAQAQHIHACITEECVSAFDQPQILPGLQHLEDMEKNANWKLKWKSIR